VVLYCCDKHTSPHMWALSSIKSWNSCPVQPQCQDCEETYLHNLADTAKGKTYWQFPLAPKVVHYSAAMQQQWNSDTILLSMHTNYGTITLGHFMCAARVLSTIHSRSVTTRLHLFIIKIFVHLYSVLDKEPGMNVTSCTVILYAYVITTSEKYSKQHYHSTVGCMTT